MRIVSEQEAYSMLHDAICRLEQGTDYTVLLRSLIKGFLQAASGYGFLKLPRGLHLLAPNRHRIP